MERRFTQLRHRGRGVMLVNLHSEEVNRFMDMVRRRKELRSFNLVRPLDLATAPSRLLAADQLIDAGVAGEDINVTGLVFSK